MSQSHDNSTGPAVVPDDATPTGPIDALTGIRWFAALMVFMSHNVPGGATPVPLNALFFNGYAGVTVFFVLSGFILTITYGGRLAVGGRHVIRDYAVARFARVYPLYIGILLPVMFWQASKNSLPDYWPVHVLGLQAWSPDVSTAYGLNPPGWSVGVEIFLYAIFPFLVVFLRPTTRSWRWAASLSIVVVVAMVVIAAVFDALGRTGLPQSDPGSAHRWLYRSPLMRTGDFSLGIACAVLWMRRSTGARYARRASLVAVIAGTVFVAVLTQAGLSNTGAGYDVAFAVPAAVLITALASSPGIGVARLFEHRIVVLLGNVSYAFFLVHVPLGRALGANPLADGFTIIGLARFLGALLIILAASFAIHVTYERRARTWIRRAFTEPRRSAGTSGA